MAWQNEKYYSKGNNTSENPIPRQEIKKPVDHVRRSGHVTTFVVCAIFSFRFQVVMLLTKTYKSSAFSVKSEMSLIEWI